MCDSIDRGIMKSPIEANPNDVPEISITDYIFENLKSKNLSSSNKPWMIDARTGVKVLFSEIESGSYKIASGLTKAGYRKGDVLHFVTYETAQLYLIQLAVWRLGGTVRGCYQQESTDEYARQLNETKAKFLLVDEETAPQMQAAAAKLDWEVKFVTFKKLEVPNSISVEALMQDDGTAYPTKNVAIDCKNDVIFIPNTSGSTGTPKGVLHTHFTAIAFNHHPKSIEHLNYDFMTPMSNFAMGSYVVALASVLHGSTIIHLGKFQKEEYLSNILKHKPGNSLMYPFVATWFARCADLESVDLSFMKIITVGGGVLDPTTAELLKKKIPHIKIVRVYAMSETLDIANTLVDTSEQGKSLFTIENEGQTCISSGKLLPYVQAKIVDVGSQTVLGVNSRGEICVRSPYIMKGYLSMNCESGIQTTTDDDGWLHTGDIGFFDSEGRIYVTDRIGFMFKYFMFLVSPAEIEAVIQEHPAVQSVGVVGIPNAATTCLAKAFVVKKGGCEVSAEELCDFVKLRLPDYKQLHSGVEFLSSLPESRGNKLDRVALQKMVVKF